MMSKAYHNVVYLYVVLVQLDYWGNLMMFKAYQNVVSLYVVLVQLVY